MDTVPAQRDERLRWKKLTPRKSQHLVNPCHTGVLYDVSLYTRLSTPENESELIALAKGGTWGRHIGTGPLEKKDKDQR